MTRNEVSIIKNAVLDATEAYVDARLANADFVKTQIGVVTNSSRNDKGKWEHTVVCNKTASSRGITYTKVLSVGNTNFSNDSIVFLIAPNAQYSNQFILGKLDSTPIEFVGGSIYIGEIEGSSPLDYYFSVNKYGQVSIKHPNSNIKLNYNTTYNDYNFIVDNNGLKLGITGSNTWNFTVNNSGKVNIRSGSITLSNVFKVDETGWLAIGGTTSSANFYVANDGTVTIKKGSMTIGSVFHIDSTGWLSVGGTTSSANFYVANDGSVTIKKGSMTIGSSFKIDTSGNLSIGGTTSSANFYVQSSDGSVTIKKGSINIGGGRFEVDSSGNVTAKYITANEGGQIGGATIYNNRLEYSDGDALLSRNLIACGTAGNGTVVLCGNQERGTSNVGGIIICNQYNNTYNKIISGLWIDGGGTIRHYDGSGNEDWWINLASPTYNHS